MPPSPPGLLIRSRRVITQGGERAAALLVRQGRIESLCGFDDAPPAGVDVLEADEAVVMAGLVDSHVHVNEPGRTEWEGFDSATRAAAAGGITTIVDMPLNSIPVTTSRAALEVKREAARGGCHVDCGFWGGVVPGNTRELEPMIDAGVAGFKAFLVHSGIDDFPAAAEDDLDAALPVLARRGVPLIVHAELDLPVSAAGASDPRSHDTWLGSRPPAWENEAVALLIRLAEKHRARVHVVHLSSAEAVPLLASAQARGVRISAETCPHYLTFDAEQVPAGRTEYKCAPPIRPRANREALWAALRAGTVEMVVSDHSPCVPALKALDRGDFMAAWGGISSVQLALSATWTEARARGVTLPQLSTWMSARPAALARLQQRKGTLAPGMDADVVVWDPDAEWTVDGTALQHRHKLTPYDGRRLRGRVQTTIVRGTRVWDRGQLTAEGAGQLL